MYFLLMIVTVVKAKGFSLKSGVPDLLVWHFNLVYMGKQRGLSMYKTEGEAVNEEEIFL